MLNWIVDHPLIVPSLATLVLFAAAAALRFLVGRRIRRGATILDALQRRQLFYLRSAITTVLLVGVIAIWLGRLENALLSLTAVAVAIVIATKELLMCISGFLMRTTGRLFSHGDWIECAGLRGEVSDHAMLSTRLLEVEPAEQGYVYTGRVVSIPNSMFLSHPVHTAPYGHRYVLHRFHITVENPLDAAAARDWLQARAAALCAPFAEEARRHQDSVKRRLGVDVAGPEPVVTVATTDLGKVRFPVQLLCPTRQAAEIERALTGEFLQAVHAGEFGQVGTDTSADARAESA